MEITWLAVAAKYRRSGLGGQLVEQTAASAAEEGFELLCALTVGPSDPEAGVADGYAAPGSSGTAWALSPSRS